MWQGRDIVFQDSEFYDRDFSLDFNLSIFFRFLREKGGGRVESHGGGAREPQEPLTTLFSGTHGTSRW